MHAHKFVTLNLWYCPSICYIASKSLMSNSNINCSIRFNWFWLESDFNGYESAWGQEYQQCNWGFWHFYSIFSFMGVLFRFYHKSIGADHQLNVINRYGRNFCTKQITWYCKFIHGLCRISFWKLQILWSAESTYQMELLKKIFIPFKPKCLIILSKAVCGTIHSNTLVLISAYELKCTISNNAIHLVRRLKLYDEIVKNRSGDNPMACNNFYCVIFAFRSHFGKNHSNNSECWILYFFSIQFNFGFYFKLQNVLKSMTSNWQDAIPWKKKKKHEFRLKYLK